MAWNGEGATIIEVLLPARAEIFFSCNRLNMALVLPTAVNGFRFFFSRSLSDQSVKLVIHLHLARRLKMFWSTPYAFITWCVVVYTEQILQYLKLH